MTERIPVLVYASDPISRTGIMVELTARPELRLLRDGDPRPAGCVAVVVADEIDDATVRLVKAVRRSDCRVVVVATQVEDGGLLAAVEAGASALLRRSEATVDALVSALGAAAAGDGKVPPDLLGRLLVHVGRLQRDVLAPRGLTRSGLSHREVEVLKLLADGLSTREIARRLAYSERTIKNVIHDVTTRMQVRNRSHAVAHAMREGLI
ncbi:MAG: LuxR C-terminal-related transcriptional regulator [Actinomycetota bacterium]